MKTNPILKSPTPLPGMERILQRNFGLDIMRCAAITMVVAVHAPFRIPGFDLAFMTCVDLFFAISGFLIAQMIAERFDAVSTISSVRAFLSNRWLRTLPLYYLFLVIYLLLFGLRNDVLRYPTPYGGLAALPPILQFSVFLQDMFNSGRFGLGVHAFFTVSWSLCVEEWFYLFFPVLMFAFGRVKRPPQFWLIIAAAFVVAVLLARLGIYLWNDGPREIAYRRVTILRADVFIYGILVYHALRKGFFDNRKGVSAILGLVLIMLSWKLYAINEESFYAKVLMPSLVPCAAALCIPWMITVKPIPIGQGVITFISTRTYSIYLSHLPLQLVWFTFWPSTTVSYAVFLVCALLLSNAIYLKLERPIMAMRPRRTIVIMRDVS